MGAENSEDYPKDLFQGLIVVRDPLQLSIDGLERRGLRPIASVQDLAGSVLDFVSSSVAVQVLDEFANIHLGPLVVRSW